MITVYQNNIQLKNKRHNKIREIMFIIQKMRVQYFYKYLLYRSINPHLFKPVIPLNIFQTWTSKDLPPNMLQNVISIKKDNPEFNYCFFDDNDCETFIEKNYPPDVLKSFQTLIPGAYKADLWRYCVLYKMGGIYLDIKYNTVKPFRLIHLTDREHWVLDLNKKGIFNAIMVCKPGNPILLKAIDQIVKNVKARFYGNSTLEPTGPLLLANYFPNEVKRRLPIRLESGYKGFHHDCVITWNHVPIISMYKGYLDERSFMGKKHYEELWKERNVYKQ
jgi:mannosyltransferase OCH1-like enzyme